MINHISDGGSGHDNSQTQSAHERGGKGGGMITMKRKKNYMMDETQPQNAGIDISALRITPKIPRDECGDSEAHNEDQWDEILVLPLDDGTMGEVRDVRYTGSSTWFEHDPSHVRVEEPLMGVIRVKVGVGVTMVGTMATTPPLDRAFHSTCTGDSKDVLQWETGVV